MDAIQGRRQWGRCTAVNRQRSPVEYVTKYLQIPRLEKENSFKLKKGSNADLFSVTVDDENLDRYLVQFKESLWICAFHSTREGEVF